MGFKYLSVDLETTGIPEKDGLENIQAIQLGAILEDTDDPKAFDDCEKFQCIIEQPNGYYGGNPYALALNSWIFKILGDQEKLRGEALLEYRKRHDIMPIGEVTEKLWEWIVKIGYDESYNALLMEKTNTHRVEDALKAIKKKGRIIPTIPKLYIVVAGKNFEKFDKLFMEEFPRWGSFLSFKGMALDPGLICFDFKTDKRTPGLQQLKDRYKVSGIVTHDALDDAFDVIEVLRKKY